MEVIIQLFKRDLRLQDNPSLVLAHYTGKTTTTPVVHLYVLEREYWELPESSPNQLKFVIQSLKTLQHNLEKNSQQLHVIEADTMLEGLISFKNEHKLQIKGLFSNQETGNEWTFNRDKRIKNWCKTENIDWLEIQQQAVWRGKQQPSNWDTTWHQWMKNQVEPIIWAKPQKLKETKSYLDIKLPTENKNIQLGGEHQALYLLQNFATDRGHNYPTSISSPQTAFHGGSRLSPHFTWGTLSPRFALQHMQKNCHNPIQLKSYTSRLYWRDNYLQTFENFNSLEKTPNLPFPEIAEKNPNNKQFLNAWETGETGYPFIDACIRCLNTHHWLNFRARAMLVSFASLQLHLKWTDFAHHLGHRFLDYEPGIHYPQLQMQAGTYHKEQIPRIYNPLKQSLEQDPKGEFIAQWVPELKNLPLYAKHTPWNYNTKIKNYPNAIVPPQELKQEAQKHFNPKKTTTQTEFKL